MNLRHGLLLAMLLAACDGGSGDDDDDVGTGPLTPAQAAEGCMTDCMHDITCGSEETLAECTEDCTGEVGWVRADAFLAIVECRAALDCAADDDQCLTECIPTATHDQFASQCTTVLTPCGSAEQVVGFCDVTPDGIDDDTGFLCLATPAIIDQLLACIPTGAACEAALPCLQGVLESNGLDF